MSLSDASRAATRAAPSGALPFSRSRALPPGPTDLRLVAATPDALRFEGYTRLQAPVLLCPLLAAIGSLPWLGFMPLDALRLAVSLGLHAFAITLLLWGWPRPVHAILRPVARELEIAGRLQSIADSSRWVLDCWHDDTTAPRGCYVASLELPSGHRWPLIQGTDPARVLRELRQALEYSPHPVECRWGIGDEARPWCFDDATVPAPRAEQGDVQRICARQASGGLLKVMWITSAFVVFDLVLLVASQRADLGYIHPLSIALPGAFGSILLLLSALLATRQRCLVIGGGRAWQEFHRFGIKRASGAVRLAEVRGVYLIGSPDAEQRHVLVDTACGPLTLPVAANAAKATELSAQRALSPGRTGSSTRAPRVLTQSGVHDKPGP